METNQDKINLIYSLFEQGFSFAKIAKKVNVDKNEVEEIVKKEYYISSRKRRSTALMNAICELARENKTAQEIKDELGLADEANVYYYLRKGGTKAFKRSRVGEHLQMTDKAKAVVEELKRQGYKPLEL